MAAMLRGITTILPGHYSWSYAGGAFPVALRSNGVFYCSSFPAAATWVSTGDGVNVDWKKFGKYTFTNEDGEMVGGQADNLSNWRKMQFIKDFTESEKLVMGDGGGSCWLLQYSGGSFEVELRQASNIHFCHYFLIHNFGFIFNFRCDGFNHFVCPQYPAHSHWTSNDNQVEIDWGKYGKYEFVIDAATGTMNGCKKGEPQNWRRATFVRPLGVDALASVAHEHAHDHEHGPGCGH